MSARFPFFNFQGPRQPIIQDEDNLWSNPNELQGSDDFEVPTAFQMQPSRGPSRYNLGSGGFGGLNFQSFFSEILFNLFDALQHLAKGQNRQGDPLCLIHAPGFADNIPDWVPGPIKQPIQAVAYKPAIYLYPPTSQEISIRLDDSIELTLDIPRHPKHQGWRVMAYPDGRLTDLQPEHTRLEAYSSQEFGFEYLEKVKASEHYPYLYWEGKQTEQPNPLIKTGVVIDREGVRPYLTKLTQQLGFSDTESQDFLGYWVPMLSNYPEWKTLALGVLQTEALNAYFPMTVSPQPTHVNRMLLLIEPNPSVETVSQLDFQVLQPFERTGFTLVEWGGMFVGQYAPINQNAAGQLELTHSS